jgi:DNA polymerase-3 subunit delta'
MLALGLAKLLLCEKPGPVAVTDVPELAGGTETVRDACGCCRSCHLVDVGNHPDLHLIYRQLNAHHPEATIRNRKAVDMGVDVIRHFLIDAAGVIPTCGRAKVFIIREADRITTAAQNALLKTLEEPPSATFLILLATSCDRLLSTTRSRCQMVRFAPLPTDFVAKKLREMTEDILPDDARLYAALAQGSLGTALRYAEDDLAAFNGELAELLADLNRTTAAPTAKRIVEFAKDSAGRYRERDRELSDTAAQRQALRVVVVLMAMWYRDWLHVLAGTAEVAANESAATRLQSAAGVLSLEAAARAVALITEAEGQLELNANVQLCIESLMFKLAAVQSPPSPAFA